MDLRMLNLSVAVFGLILVAHAILALTKHRGVTCLFELIAAAILFWQLRELWRRPAPTTAPRS